MGGLVLGEARIDVICAAIEWGRFGRRLDVGGLGRERALSGASERRCGFPTTGVDVSGLRWVGELTFFQLNTGWDFWRSCRFRHGIAGGFQRWGLGGEKRFGEVFFFFRGIFYGFPPFSFACVME